MQLKQETLISHCNSGLLGLQLVLHSVTTTGFIGVAAGVRHSNNARVYWG